MIALNNINRVYRSGNIQTSALRDFSLTVAEGDFIAVTGPSGSGKSTLLNILGLLEPFDQGEYLLDGVSIKSLNDDQLSQMRNEKIGFIFQNYNLIPDFSLFDNVDMPLRYRGFNAAQRKRRIESALTLVGLESRQDFLPSQLSGGQQQRVAIARALAGEPRILLADEPTGNLDSLMASQIMELLQQLNERGSTIIMVTHDPQQAQSLPRNIQIIDGAIIEQSVYSPPTTSERQSVKACS